MKQQVSLAALLAAICLILLSLSATAEAQGRNKVHYDEIKTITLKKGQYTAARRLDPIPQLKCTSGACNLYQPDVVQCYNMGSDGRGAQWKCESQMNEKFKFGKVKVLCEGYDRPGDIYVLPGSCGLEYELLLTEAGKAYYQEQNGGIPRGYYREAEQDADWNGFRRSNSFEGDSLSPATIFLVVAAVLIILFFCIKAPQNRAAYTASQASRPSTTSSSSSGYSRMYPDSQQPPYNPEYNDGYNYSTSSRPSTTYSSSSYTSNSDSSSRPGFWSGAAMGAAAGYAMGRATAPSTNSYGTYTTHPTNNSSYGSYFTNNSSGSYTSNMYPNTSSTTTNNSSNSRRENEYTATGYADTETR